MTLSAKARRHVEAFDRTAVDLFASPEPRVWICVGEAEAHALVRGQVPLSVVEQARMVCDQDWPRPTKGKR